MKTNYKTILKTAFTIALLITALFFSSCDDNDPKKEDVPELITRAVLTFTPQDGSSAVTVQAVDPDGQGVQSIAVSGPINLQRNKTYLLTIDLFNELAAQGSAEYNISEEVEEEGDEHMFFFGWTANLFADPTGDGNIDNRTDAVNYSGASNALDENNLPLGLTTTWTTTGSSGGGTFRVLLKHQPELKSANSTSTVGETDLDLTFNIGVQ